MEFELCVRCRGRGQQQGARVVQLRTGTGSSQNFSDLPWLEHLCEVKPSGEFCVVSRCFKVCEESSFTYFTFGDGLPDESAML